nr:glycosyltransferase family 1 protein [uncultured Gellertiella sp.]
MHRITIVTDAWHPQINGVVRSIENTILHLSDMGAEVMLITPSGFRSIPCPTYPEIRLSITSYGAVARALERCRPSFVHIATEGPLGLLARYWCIRNGRPFTTCYHTRFPEYVAARFPVPERLLYGFVRWFHNAGAACMVATESLEQELSARGLKRLVRWTRGIDTGHFRPREQSPEPFGLKRPLFVSIGRVAPEKNLTAFLDLDLPGSKIVVGDGPARASLQARYPDVHFAGMQHGEALARYFAEADVFVFPSRTDTFGNTILEALASGVPVAAFPVTGPFDILKDHPDAGTLGEDLHGACLRALGCSRQAARSLAETYSWEAASRQFLDQVLSANRAPRPGILRRISGAYGLRRGFPKP